MVSSTPDFDIGVETDGAPDAACASCGHGGEDHVVRDIEVAGDTKRETFCEGCDALCEFLPAPER